MCGFLGEFMFQDNGITSRSNFESLLKLSKHRGPDSTLVISQKTFQLGFNRLSILDISHHGNQPMISPSNRYVIVFNGEIYNYKELATTYELKNLKSTSDTEVLVHLIDQFGAEEAIKKLNGMYAIVVMDKDKNRFFLSRDFAGIKPLFYGVSREGLVCASQFDQVFQHPMFRSKLNIRKDVMKEYFGLGYMQSPNTIYNNIFQVNPGELISVSQDGTIHKKVLLRFATKLNSNSNFKDVFTTKRYDSLLHDVIKKQLVSDVSIASFLSGGIDSPLIAAIAKSQKNDIEAFTIGVEDKKFDESEKAIAYADYVGLKHHIEHIDESSLIKYIDRHFQFFSEPFGDYSSIPTYAITKKAKSRHTVMLSGDGGDELFFGYPRMLDVYKNRFWFKIPHAIRKPLIRVAIKLKLAKTWGPFFYDKIDQWVLAKQLHISKRNLNTIITDTNFSKELKALYTIPKRKQTKENLLHWLRYNEFYAHMQRVLVKVDRMSMANSLEVRVPLLDKASINFAWNYMPKFKNNRFKLKDILKKMMTLYYPSKVIEEEKKGFSVPIEIWLKTHLKSDVENVIFEKPLYGEKHINKEVLLEYVTRFFNGEHNEAWGVWHIYAWQKWALGQKLIR